MHVVVIGHFHSSCPLAASGSRLSLPISPPLFPSLALLSLSRNLSRALSDSVSQSDFMSGERRSEQLWKLCL